MLTRVKKSLVDVCQINPDLPLVVGVSGGPDSLCLLHVLKKLGFHAIVAHLNHGIRPEAAAEAEFVKAASGELGFKHHAKVDDAPSHAEKEGLAIEEAARRLRYTFLFGVAEEEKAQAVAVGHNADDQVETVLMHLLRGAGLSGLRGMQARIVLPSWHEQIPLVRPLLGVWRREVMAYCEEHNLEPRFDRSNLDTTYFRNRLRHELVPVLESYNPRIRELTWRMGNTLQTDFEVIEMAIDAVWAECVEEVGEDYVRVNRDVFSRQPIGIQRGLSRRVMAVLRPGLRDIDYEAVERVLAFVHQPPETRQSDLIAGLRIQLEGDHFLIADWEADIPLDDYPQIGERTIPFDIPAKVTLGNGWFLSAEAHPAEKEILDQALNNPDPFVGWFNAAGFGGGGNIRTIEQGDRFIPLGMGGHGGKLADFFINVKLPKRARKAWPLVCASEEIAWVPGYRIGHSFRITADTNRILKLYLFKKS
ncbi:MAG: tRNA lysidine(34) synthetase TilS [Anaerolineales bacterium]|jgi:tRNA(Ile)-lysidine synthase